MTIAATIKCYSRKLFFFFFNALIQYYIGIAFSKKIILLPYQTLVVQYRKKKEENIYVIDVSTKMLRQQEASLINPRRVP